MTAPSEQSQLFTIDDANRMLPLVRVIVADIVPLVEDLSERQRRLEVLVGAESEGDDPYSEEVRQMQQEMDADKVRLDDYIAELADLGVDLSDPMQGEVDFRTQIEEQEAFLCWKLGEPEVGHWHPEDTGFAGRQSLLQGANSSDSFSSPESTES